MTKQLTIQDISQVARIHKKEIVGFLPELGVGFLQKFYKTAITIPEIFILVEKENEQILGFVSGITNPKGLYKKIILKDIFGFALFFLRYFITHPTTIVKFIQIMTYPGFSEDIPELLTIAIDRKYQNKGIGRKLFMGLVKEFRNRKVGEFKISVYAKLGANGFYRKLGCRLVRTFDFLGEAMNYYTYGDTKRLRVILLTYDSLYANPIFIPLLDKPSVEIVAVVLSDCILYKKNTLQSLIFLYRKHGFFYFSFKVIDQILYLITGAWNLLSQRQKRLLWEAGKRNIPILKMKDVNSRESLSILSSYHPDLLISYFNQLLKKESLTLPKLGCINIHPGYLPLYRGVGSSFYAMLNGEKFGGVTIHYMLEKLDSGDIVSREKVFFEEDESLHRHNFRCCQTGGRLLLKVLDEIGNNKVKRIRQEKGANYYSWPTATDVTRFLACGYRLISLRDMKLYFLQSKLT